MDYLSRSSSHRNAFNKAVRVIDSCENIYQLKAARTYINLFFNQYSKSFLNRNNFRTYYPSPEIANLYNDLLTLIIDKESKFS